MQRSIYPALSGRYAITQNNDSLGKRYLIKLASNLATTPLFLVMEAVLPRALGPATYGNFNYATALFQNFSNFLDMGTSTCLNTALAKRPEERSLAAFYARAALAMLLLTLGAGLLLGLPPLHELFLPGVPLWLVLPAAFWAYLTWTGRVVRGMSDALGHTWRSEPVRIINNLASVLALVLLYLSGLLSLPVLFAHQFFFLGLLTLGFCLVLRKNWGIPSWRLEKGQGKAYTREFFQYSAPLFVTALCSALALSGERWLLQFFDGSVEQGFFSLSQRIGMACFLFVSAMTPLLMRELAVAHGRGDRQSMAALLDRYAPMIYAVAAWMACFVLAEAPAVVRLFGGAAFADAVLPVQIMALYPIHQGYGQVAGAVFYASGQTRRLRDISLAGLALGLGAAWLFVAPADYGGMGLGATGLAVKMVLVQFITVNLLLFACRKTTPFRYGRNLAHQLIAPLAFAALAWACRLATMELSGLGPESLPRFFAAGALYCLGCLCLAFAFPFALGLRRGEIAGQLARVRALRK